MSDSVQTPSEFRKRIADIQRNITSDEIKKNLRRTLIRISGKIRQDVRRDLAGALPRLSNRIDNRIVARRVYNDLTGFRVRVTNESVSTGRATQPYVPLPYLYEHGYRAHRMTRGKGLDRGPSSPKSGVHVLDRHQSDLDWAEREYLAALEEYLIPNLDKING